MIVLDMNVLVAAHRADHPHHPSARAFVEAALRDDAVVVPDLVWCGFLRVVTNRRAFRTPTPLDDAAGFVRAVVASSGYRPVAGLAHGLEPFLALVVGSAARTNLVPDAYIAAVAIAHGCPVATYDRDFRRFDGLRVVTPA